MTVTNKTDVLIVDDDKNICEIFKEYCISLKYFNKIVVTNDGSSAMFKLQNQKFGLIILDISMPRKNGIDVLTREFSDKDLNKKDNIVVISGALETEIAKRLIQNGVNFKDKITKMIA